MIEDFRALDKLDLSTSMFICNEGVEKFVLMASEKNESYSVDYGYGYGYFCKTSNNEVKSFASYAVSSARRLSMPLIRITKPPTF